MHAFPLPHTMPHPLQCVEVGSTGCVTVNDCCDKTNFCQKEEMDAALLGGCSTVRWIWRGTTLACKGWANSCLMAGPCAAHSHVAPHAAPAAAKTRPPIPCCPHIALQCVADEMYGCTSTEDCCNPFLTCNDGRCGWVQRGGGVADGGQMRAARLTCLHPHQAPVLPAPGSGLL